MPHEAQIEFRNAAEAIISKVEQRLTENKESTHALNYREQILNPNLSEAREFIQGLWLPEADMLILMQYSIISNEKPIEDLNWIPQAEVFRQLEEMRAQHIPEMYTHVAVISLNTLSQYLCPLSDMTTYSFTSALPIPFAWTALHTFSKFLCKN